MLVKTTCDDVSSIISTVLSLFSIFKSLFHVRMYSLDLIILYVLPTDLYVLHLPTLYLPTETPLLTILPETPLLTILPETPLLPLLPKLPAIPVLLVLPR